MGLGLLGLNRLDFVNAGLLPFAHEVLGEDHGYVWVCREIDSTVFGKLVVPAPD